MFNGLKGRKMKDHRKLLKMTLALLFLALAYLIPF
jgi:hypothetical protein